MQLYQEFWQGIVVSKEMNMLGMMCGVAMKEVAERSGAPSIKGWLRRLECKKLVDWNEVRMEIFFKYKCFSDEFSIGFSFNAITFLRSILWCEVYCIVMFKSENLLPAFIRNIAYYCIKVWLSKQPVASIVVFVIVVCSSFCLMSFRRTVNLSTLLFY